MKFFSKKFDQLFLRLLYGKFNLKNGWAQGQNTKIWKNENVILNLYIKLHPKIPGNQINFNYYCDIGYIVLPLFKGLFFFYKVKSIF